MRYFQAIFDYLEEHGVWPTFAEIDHSLYTTADLDAAEIAKSLGTLNFGSGYMPWLVPDSRLQLPLRIVAWCRGSEPLLELVVATVDLAVKTERKTPNPTITSKQIQDGWGVSDSDLRRLGALLLAEPSIWAGGFGGPEESGYWSMGVGRNIRTYRDVKSVEQLVAKLPPLQQPQGVRVVGAPNVASGDISAATDATREGLAEIQREHPDPNQAKGHATPEAVRVFVSHHHSPEEDAFTARLVADLEAAGADVWVDTEGITSDDFVQKISEGLAGRQWLVLVMTPGAIASPWVRREVNAALSEVTARRMLGVIPFVMNPCREEDIPVIWRPLHRYNATNGYVTARDGLLQAIGLSPLPSS
jgi:hypothetical protein